MTGGITYYGLPAGDPFRVTLTFDRSRLGRAGAITGVITPALDCGT